jgi:hypothetical protein
MTEITKNDVLIQDLIIGAIDAIKELIENATHTPCELVLIVVYPNKDTDRDKQQLICSAGIPYSIDILKNSLDTLSKLQFSEVSKSEEDINKDKYFSTSGSKTLN